MIGNIWHISLYQLCEKNKQKKKFSNRLLLRWAFKELEVELERGAVNKLKGSEQSYNIAIDIISGLDELPSIQNRKQ